MDGHYKDEILDRLAESTNVAQFVSFDPRLRQRYSRLHGLEANHRFASAEDAIRTAVDRSPERSVNIRTFEPGNPKSRDFVYGITDPADALARVRAFGAAGLTTIVNETVDVNDGGVSGVAFGGVVEFAPGDTPRCVEKPGTLALPRDLALPLFRTVYGFQPELPGDTRDRVEFSIHPLRRGYRHTHTIIWEIERLPGAPAGVPIRWPNRFSRFIGDKAFGLLIASLLGFDVPRTTVIPRRLAPFSFGDGGTSEPWLRTCPTEQVPGRFTTARGWPDPFLLLQREDPSGKALASVLHQHGIDAVAAGAAIAQSNGELLVEGVRGLGDEFMVGHRAPERVPDAVLERVRVLYGRVADTLGPSRFEWVDDGTRTWIVQLHSGASVSQGRTIVPGTPAVVRRFDVNDGLEALRALIEDVKSAGEGIVLVGHVGLTSHFGDVLRRAGVPSQLEAPD